MSFTKFANLFFLFSPLLIPCFLIVVIFAAFFPPLGIILPIGLFICFWAFHDPVKPLILAISLLPFDKLTVIFPPQTAVKGMTFLSSITIPKLILVIVFVAWVSRILVLKEGSILKRLSENYLSLPTVIFFILCFASVMNVELEGINLWFGYEMRLLNLVVLFFILVHHINRKEHLRKTIKCLVVSYFFVSFMGLYEVMNKQHILDLVGYPTVEAPFTISGEFFRVIGPAGGPDVFSFGTVFAFGLTLFFLGPESSKKTKVILIPVLALHLFSMIGSGSRGALLAILGTVSTFWLFVRLRHKWFLGISFFVGAGLLLFIYTLCVSDLALERLSGERGISSITYRIGWSKMAWGMIKDNPFLGVGFANFPMEYNRYLYLAPEAPSMAAWTHNSFLQVWAESGLFALLSYLSLYALAIINLYKVIKTSRDSTVQQAAICSVSLLVGMILFAVTSNVIVFELYWMNFAFAVIVSNLSKTTTA